MSYAASSSSSDGNGKPGNDRRDSEENKVKIDTSSSVSSARIYIAKEKQPFRTPSISTQKELFQPFVPFTAKKVLSHRLA